MPKFIDITGEKYGRLTAIKYMKHQKWLWRCDCGNYKVIKTSLVKRGETKSCGCLMKEYHERRNNAGAKKNKQYKLWHSIKTRCYCETDIHFPDYGARGITIADEWKYDFWSFYDYISKLPHFEEEGYSIDRINNDGNYEPGNVRWASCNEQARNRRSNTKITAFGKTQTCADWAEEYNMNYYTLWSRIYDIGLDPEVALTKPLKGATKNGNNITSISTGQIA